MDRMRGVTVRGDTNGVGALIYLVFWSLWRYRKRMKPEVKIMIYRMTPMVICGPECHGLSSGL